MQLVIPHKEKVSTTSLLIAEKFGKEHKNVLRDIENIECSFQFSRLNFELSNYKVRGKDYPMYILTRDAFTMLMMSFTGSMAAKFREEFIEEFNRMEAIIRMGVTPVLIPTYQKRMLSEPTLNCPESHWCIFDAASKLMLFVEKNIGSINKYDLLDGSIGSRWAKYREGKIWAVESAYYKHEYEDNRGSRDCKCYQNSELEHFKKWLRELYKPIHLYDYLQDKYKKEKNVVMLDKVNHVLPLLLQAS